MASSSANKSKTDKKTQSADTEHHSQSTRSFEEVLYLLRSKVKLGKGIPEMFHQPPWNVSAEKQNASTLNEIINHSFKVQSGHIPDCGDFEKFILSNSSLLVAGLLKLYLETVIVSLICDVTLGVLLWDESARLCENDFEGNPFLWLDVYGQPIDNSYIHFPGKTDMQQKIFLITRRPQYYKKEDPFKSTRKIHFGEKTKTLRHNFKIFRGYGNNENIEKYVLLSLNSVELNPCPKMYDICMRHFLKEKFQAEPIDLMEKWSKRCWKCLSDSDPSSLKTCSNCKLAKYCSKACQIADWKIHKSLDNELKFAKQILAEENENEDE